MAERLGTGLQNLLRQFDPAHGLTYIDVLLYGKQSKRGYMSIWPLFSENPVKAESLVSPGCRDFVILHPTITNQRFSAVFTGFYCKPPINRYESIQAKEMAYPDMGSSSIVCDHGF